MYVKTNKAKKVKKFSEYIYTDNIKIERFKKKLRQVDMAKLLGISLSMYAMLESGEVEPRITFINKLSEILGKPAGYFFKLYGYESTEKDI